jgi:hypothetical protein
MDLPPLPGDASLAGIGDGRAGPEPAFPRGPGPGGAPGGGGAREGPERGPRGHPPSTCGQPQGGQPEAAEQGGGGPFGSPEAASGEGGACLRHPLFQGLLGALQAAVGGLTGEGQTPDPGLGSRATRPHTFPPPGGPFPPASPCGVYAGIPGDPPQLHAGRPPLRALLGPSPARRGTFAKVRNLRLLRTFPVPWKRRRYRGRYR